MEKSSPKKTVTKPRITKPGICFLVSAVALLFVGLIFGESTAAYLGCSGLVIMVAARLMAIYNFKHVRVSRVTPGCVYAEHPFEVKLEVTNDKPILDTFSMEVGANLLAKVSNGILVRWLRPGDRASRDFVVAIKKRGHFQFFRHVVRSSFPFGFFEMAEARIELVDLLVFPKPAIPDFLERALQTQLVESDRVSVQPPELRGDIRGMREFQPGDPIRSIHWPASARGQGIQVREMDPPMPNPQTFAIHYHGFCPPRYLVRPNDFERAMQLLAGILFYCRKHGILMSLTGSFNDWKVLKIRDPHDLNKGLTLLSAAHHKIERNTSMLSQRLNECGENDRAFVVGDTDLKHWINRMPERAQGITCLDARNVHFVENSNPYAPV